MFHAFEQETYRQLMLMDTVRRSHVGEAMIDELNSLWEQYNVEQIVRRERLVG